MSKCIENCASCIYIVYLMEQQIDSLKLKDTTCHRFPPVYDPVSESLGATRSVWPSVVESEWCGEFKMRAEVSKVDRGGVKG